MIRTGSIFKILRLSTLIFYDSEDLCGLFTNSIDSKSYKIRLHKISHLPLYLNLRCKYETDGALMGYSRPHIVLKYDSSVRADITVVPKWGLDVDPQSPVLLESSKRINFASCAQKTNGPPAPMALKASV